MMENLKPFTYSMYPHNTRRHEPNLYNYPEGFVCLLEYPFLSIAPVRPLYFRCPLHFDDPDTRNLYKEKNN